MFQSNSVASSLAIPARTDVQNAYGLLTTVLLSIVFTMAGIQQANAGMPIIDETAFQVEGRSHSGPKAYRSMCDRDPSLCEADRSAALHAGTNPAATLTKQRWAVLEQVNLEVNRRVAPREDMEVYGTSDFWTAGRFVGDCEDYMISKKQALMAAGWTADQLLYAVVEGIETPYHAVLIVRTDHGDFVLDNLTDRISRWDRSGYRFVIRQSSENPDRWVRVLDDAPRTRNERFATR